MGIRNGVAPGKGGVAELERTIQGFPPAHRYAMMRIPLCQHLSHSRHAEGRTCALYMTLTTFVRVESRRVERPSEIFDMTRKSSLRRMKLISQTFVTGMPTSDTCATCAACDNSVVQVVARVLVCGVECGVPLRVLHLVLLLQTPYNRLRPYHGVLRLYAGDRSHVLLAYGQLWILRVLLVSSRCQ